MRNLKPLFFALAGLLLGMPLFAQEPIAKANKPVVVPKKVTLVQPPEKISPEVAAEVDRWALLLANDDFHEREAAARNLIRIGPPSLLKLQSLVKSDDIDLRYRAEELVTIIQTQSLRATIELTDHKEKVLSIAFSPDGSLLASAGGGLKQGNRQTEGGDFAIRLWNTNRWEKVKEIEGHRAAVNHVTWSPDGQWLLSASDDLTARMWNVKTREEFRSFRGHEEKVVRAKFTPDGKEVVTAAHDGKIRVFDIHTGKLNRSIAWSQGKLLDFDISPDGKKIAACGEDPAVRLIQLENGEPLRLLEKHKQRVLAVAFSSDGSKLFSGGGDAAARIWNVAKGEQIRVFNTMNEAYNVVAWSTDMRFVATAVAREKLIYVYDANKGNQLRVFKGHRDVISQIEFSADGLSLVSCSPDRTIRIWPLVGINGE